MAEWIPKIGDIVKRKHVDSDDRYEVVEIDENGKLDLRTLSRPGPVATSVPTISGVPPDDVEPTDSLT